MTICRICLIRIQPEDTRYAHFQVIFANEGLVYHDQLPEVASRYAQHKIHGDGITFDELVAERRALKKSLAQKSDTAATETVAEQKASVPIKPVLTGEARRQEIRRLQDLAIALQHRYPVSDECRKNAVLRAFERGTSLESELAKSLRGVDRRSRNKKQEAKAA